jgi:hypothetical protein
MLQGFPTLRNNDLPIPLVVTIVVHDQRQLADNRQKDATPMRILGGRERHADRRLSASVAFPKQIGPVFETIAVGVAEHMDIAVVANRDQLSIFPIRSC